MTHRATIEVVPCESCFKLTGKTGKFVVLKDSVVIPIHPDGSDQICGTESEANAKAAELRGEAERAQANIAGISAGEITAREIYEKTGLALSDEQVQIIQKNTDWWLEKERLAVSTPPSAPDWKEQWDNQLPKRLTINLDENCIETIERLTPEGGEEISFGGLMGGVMLKWTGNPAALSPAQAPDCDHKKGGCAECRAAQAVAGEHEWSKAVLSPFCVRCGLKMDIISVKTSCIEAAAPAAAPERAWKFKCTEGLESILGERKFSLESSEGHAIWFSDEELVQMAKGYLQLVPLTSLPAPFSPPSASDFKAIIEQVNDLMEKLKHKPKHLRIGFLRCPGGILNAYREGDLTFDEAVNLLQVKPLAEKGDSRA